MSEKRLERILAQGSLHELRKIINEDIKAVDVARLLESSPPKERRVLWGLLDETRTGQVLSDLDEDVRADFLNQLQADEIAESFEHISDDDITDILHQLPERVIGEVLQQMETEDRERVEQLLDYPEGTAGAVMTTQILTVRPHISLEVVMRYIRRAPEIDVTVGKLVVVNVQNKFLGLLTLSAVLHNSPSKRVSEVMDADPIILKVTDDHKRIVEVFERYDMVSVPVVDDEHRFVGMVTVDDVVDIMLQARDQALLGGSGVSAAEDTFAPLWRVTEKRVVWLGINLVTVVLASFFIGMFQKTLEQLVALAILMPIVASMGGIAGGQSMTIVIRAQALDRLTISNTRWLLMREIGVGLINGVLWALVISVLAFLWFGELYVSASLGLALIGNLLLGSLLGVLLPLFLNSYGVDPANAGGVLLTTATDVVGFVSFLGLATLFYF